MKDITELVVGKTHFQTHHPFMQYSFSVHFHMEVEGAYTFKSRIKYFIKKFEQISDVWIR